MFADNVEVYDMVKERNITFETWKINHHRLLIYIGCPESIHPF
jgi:hypothetical protein